MSTSLCLKILGKEPCQWLAHDRVEMHNNFKKIHSIHRDVPVFGLFGCTLVREPLCISITRMPL